jgi:hypothetical protein
MFLPGKRAGPEVKGRAVARAMRALGRLDGITGDSDRDDLMVFGFVSRLPEDTTTPPPPGSQTAQRQPESAMLAA